jgi:ferredoxin
MRIDWVACDAHGMCAELFPEGIALDEWGYPVIDPNPIPRELEAHAKRAAASCPTFALALEKATGTAPSTTASRSRPGAAPAPRP